MGRSVRFTTTNPSSDVNVRRTFPTVADASVLGTPLTLADFSNAYRGCACLPAAGVVTDYSNARGQMSGRRVGGQTRLFVMGNSGNGFKVVEVAPPTSFHATAAAAIAAGSSGRFSIVNDWGNIYNGAPSDYLKNSSGETCDVVSGVHYQDGGLYWSFYYSYNTSSFNDRVLGRSVLNDASPGPGQIIAVDGPWRTSNTSKKVGGTFTKIPTAFANTYLGGRTLGMCGQAQSGVTTSPFGGSLYAFAPPNGSISPSVYSNQSDVALTGTRAMLFDINARMPLAGLSRKVCFWDDPGNHAIVTAPVSAGATSIPIDDTTLFAASSQSQIGVPPPYYGGYAGPTITDGSTIRFYYAGKSVGAGAGSLTGIPPSGEGSITAPIAAGTFILLEKYDNGRGGTSYAVDDYWGPKPAAGPHVGDVGSYFDYLTGAAMIRTSTNKTGLFFMGNLCDTVAGVDYSPDTVNHIAYSGHNACPHGQTSIFFQSTGPISKTLVPYAWLYSFADVADLILGNKTEAQLSTQLFTRLSAISTFETAVSHNNGTTGAAWFNDETDSLYAIEANRDSTSAPGVNEPLVHYWQF